jgi:uncharacterized protein (DUF58 family)
MRIARRVMLRLTLSGRVFVGMAVVLQIASITSQSGLLIWLVGLLLGCLAVNAGAAILSLRRLSLEAPSVTLVEEGSAPAEAWKVSNRGRITARLILVEHSGRVWMRVREARPRETVAALAGKISARRGVYSLTEAVIATTFPFGLVKISRESGARGEVLVFPKLPQVEAPDVRGLDLMFGGAHTGKGRAASGAAFAGVRPAVAGDSFRQVHWKSSAKGRGLMVKTFDEELGGRATIVAAIEAGANAEERLRFAGALALAAVEAGHQVTWLDAISGRKVDLQAFADESALLEELARFRFAERIVVIDAQELPKRSAVHLVATEQTEVLARAVEELRRSGREVWLHLPTQ